MSTGSTPTMTIEVLRRRAAPRLERAVQREVLRFLNALPGVEAFPYKPGLFRAEYKDRERRVRTGKAGVSDVLGFVSVSDGGGRRVAQFMAFEVKRERGGLVTHEQMAFLHRARAAGAICGIVRGVADVVAILAAAGWRDGRAPEGR